MLKGKKKEGKGMLSFAPSTWNGSEGVRLLPRLTAPPSSYATCMSTIKEAIKGSFFVAGEVAES